MGQQQRGVISGMSNGAIARYARVKFTASGWVTAGDEAWHGVAQNATTGAGQPVAVRPKRDPGTQCVIAGGAIAIGDTVTTAASGKSVSGTGGVDDFGLAVSAASGDGAFVEVLVI